MQDVLAEFDHLAKAERDVADGERRVTAQMLLVERLRGAGQDAHEAERLLLNLGQTLQAWRDHRELILREIARLERAAPL